VVDSIRLGFRVQWQEVNLISEDTGQQALEGRLIEGQPEGSPLYVVAVEGCPTGTCRRPENPGARLPILSTSGSRVIAAERHLVACSAAASDNGRSDGGDS
jgi:hypothetical protein